MIERSVVLDVRHVGWLNWTATWRIADDVGLGKYPEGYIKDRELNMADAFTRKRAINKACKTLQRRVDEKVERIRRQRKHDNEVERVEVILDVTALREEQNA